MIKVSYLLDLNQDKFSPICATLKPTLRAFYICPYSVLKSLELAQASPALLCLDYEQI
jgi:hypothetical protein